MSKFCVRQEPINEIYTWHNEVQRSCFTDPFESLEQYLTKKQHICDSKRKKEKSFLNYMYLKLSGRFKGKIQIDTFEAVFLNKGKVYSGNQSYRWIRGWALFYCSQSSFHCSIVFPRASWIPQRNTDFMIDLQTHFFLYPLKTIEILHISVGIRLNPSSLSADVLY